MSRFRHTPFGFLARWIRGEARRSAGFDAAGGGRRWEGAPLVTAPVTQGMAAAGAILPRARAAYENNALARSIVDSLVSSLVGSGMTVISTREPALSERFARDSETFDATGALDFEGVQHLAALHMVRDGECFIRHGQSDDDRPTLQVLTPEQVDRALTRELGDGRRIIAGIELDAAGRRIAYHVFRDPPDVPFASALDTVRVDAADMIHLYRPSYAGQVRGVSWLAPVLLMLTELDKCTDAQVVRQQIAALHCGFVLDQEGGTAGFSVSDNGNGPGISLEPGALHFLGPNQDFKSSSPAQIGEDSISFMRLAQHTVAAGAGVTYEAMTGDYSQVNYSSARAALNEHRRRIEALQHHLIGRQLIRPVWRRWLTLEALSGRIRLDGFARDPEAWMGCKIIPPGWWQVDPQKEVEAEIAAINAGLKSRREVVAARGYDLRQLDREIAEDAASAPAAPPAAPPTEGTA